MRLTRRLSSLTLALLMLILCACKSRTALKITFSGAVAFVLAHKGDANHTDYVTALAVHDDDTHSHLNTHLAQDVAYFRATAPVPAHYAYLRVPARNYCATPDGPCDALPEGGPTYYYFHLDGVKITIGNLATSGGGVQLVGIDQIPRLGQISSDTYKYGAVCAECLDGTESYLGRVAAWFRFARGTFRRGSGVASSGLYYHDADGTEQDAHPPQQISLLNNATLCADLDSNIVKVDLVPLPGGAGGKSFRLRAASGEHNIPIDLIDAPPSDMLCQVEGCIGPGYLTGQAVSHFDLFYELSEVPYDASAHYVYPHVRATPHLGNPYCSIVMMDP
jgi:hypothetical protein